MSGTRPAFVFKTEKEIVEMRKDIAQMEEAIRAKEAPLKLAETRLENRTCRPSGMELCRDNAQYGLVNEVVEIKNTIKALKDKLKQEQWVILITIWSKN